MSLSPFFLQLRSAYQAELDDLTSDSEGRGVLRQRLAEKRQELGFLVKMIEISPEMVAVVFHQGFRFVQPAVFEHLICQDADDLPDWVGTGALDAGLRDRTEVVLVGYPGVVPPIVDGVSASSWSVVATESADALTLPVSQLLRVIRTPEPATGGAR